MNRTQPTNTAWKQPVHLVFKRAMDMIIAPIALVALSPAMVAIAILIRLDSPGPSVFAQTRIGKGGRPFRMFKFRTMHNRPNGLSHEAFMRAFVRGEIGPEGNGKLLYKPFSSDSVTRIGEFLRRTSLDELPQLLNVIRGEMSLVGPRPNVPCEVEEYARWHRERLDALPGITGLAQVNGRSTIDFDTIVRYDIEYIRNQSLRLDLRILWRTVASVLKGDGVG